MLDFENITGFDWDDGNKYKNEDKHNVSIKEAEEVFKSFPLLISDAKVEDEEERRLAYGKSDSNKFLAIVFVVRNNRIRIISARPQSRKERKTYNETTKEKLKTNPKI